MESLINELFVSWGCDEDEAFEILEAFIEQEGLREKFLQFAATQLDIQDVDDEDEE